MLPHRPPVQLHADGDEKQAQQHIVKRTDVGFHHMLVLRLGDQHARQEGPQGQGQAGVLGEPGQAQGDEQQVEHEQLIALSPGHHGEPGAHDPWATPQQRTHQHRSLEQGDAQCDQQIRVGRRSQRRDQHQQRHHRQILE